MGRWTRRLKRLERRREKRRLLREGSPALAADRTRPSEAKRQVRRVTSKAFLESFEWRRLRMEVLKRYGARCMCCGATPADGVKMHVDHIKPRRKYPELALDPDNLQVLCEECNHGKGNWDETDWRPAEAKRPPLLS